MANLIFTPEDERIEAELLSELDPDHDADLGITRAWVSDDIWRTVVTYLRADARHAIRLCFLVQAVIDHSGGGDARDKDDLFGEFDQTFTGDEILQRASRAYYELFADQDHGPLPVTMDPDTGTDVGVVSCRNRDRIRERILGVPASA